jgi:exodeoxyribonuclease VII large subunit
VTLFPPEEVGDPTLTVSQLAAGIADALSAFYPNEVWVRGQIRNLNRSNLGHVYFTLAEPDGEATISVFLSDFHRKVVNQMLRRTGAVRMTDGTDVRIRGRVSYFGPRGQVQLRMTAIDPAYTLGQLAAERDRVLRALAADGLLDRNASRPLPVAPLRIGLVTSPGSAAQADFLHELERSGLRFEVVLAGARVQGLDAERTIVAALRAVAARGVEVVALVRGGGARTDLAAFDAEVIARAIAELPVPVLTGIGHEIDRSIADDVAHTAHKTPTACAAALVDRVRGFVDRADRAWIAVAAGAAVTLTTGNRLVDERAGHVARASRAALDLGWQSTGTLAIRVGREAARTVDRAGVLLERDAGRVQGAARHHLRAHDERLAVTARQLSHRAGRAGTGAERHLDALDGRLRALDPARTLARGWSFTRTAGGRVVRRPEDAPPGTAIVTTLAGGALLSTVDGDD